METVCEMCGNEIDDTDVGQCYCGRDGLCPICVEECELEHGGYFDDDDDDGD